MRYVLVMRQNHTAEAVAADATQPTAGAKRTLTFMPKNENQADIDKLAPLYITQDSVISADESDAYDKLGAKYRKKRVNHSQAYRADDGTTKT